MPTQAEIIRALIDLWSKDPTLASVPIRRMAVDAAEVVQELERDAQTVPIVDQIATGAFAAIIILIVLDVLGGLPW